MIPVMIFISCLYDSFNEFVHGGGWSKFWGLEAAVLNLIDHIRQFVLLRPCWNNAISM